MPPSSMASASDDDRPDDLILVGGGLANGLIALRLSAARPELAIRLIEAGPALGGRHTWSFFDTDLTPVQRAWVAPLVVHRWPGYGVRFPAHSRRLDTPYNSISSERLDAVLRAIRGLRITLNAPAAQVEPAGVRLADGRRFHAAAVIDGRGPVPTPDLALGYQKFVGLEVRLDRAHGLAEPIVMDATVDQRGGYRFLYVLPLDERRLLIEDTRYADTPDPDREALRQGAFDYARDWGWSIEAVVQEESGVLPVALDGDLAAHLQRLGPAAQVGLRAGLFHPTTGYSLPDAARLADLLADTLRLSDADGLPGVLRDHALAVWRSRAFYRLLDRMLFRAALPQERYRVLERFYRLPQPLIERFYAARSTLADKARILSGKPPVPIARALPCLIERGRS